MKQTYVIYVKGVSEPQNNGGWASRTYLMKPNDKTQRLDYEKLVLERSGFEFNAVAYRMELHSAIDALNNIPEGSRVYILTQDELVANILLNKSVPNEVKDLAASYIGVYTLRNIEVYIQHVNSSEREFDIVEDNAYKAIDEVINEGNSTSEGENMFVAFTDGSCNNLEKKRRGGWAYLIFDALRGKPDIVDARYKGSGCVKGVTSNNRMELRAIVEAIKALPMRSKVCIFTDSQYCIMVLDHKTKMFAKNMDYIKWFNDEVFKKRITYEFRWIKGHNGNIYNEEVDRMAVAEFNKTSTIAGMDVSDFVSEEDFDRYKKPKRENV